MRKEIIGYQAVREAAKDFETYSSDLLGDRDVRSYRQLPLEADPPRHTMFREAVQPLFLSAAIEPKKPQFQALAKKLIEQINQQGGGDIPGDLALPFVIGCLTIIYNRPQDYDEWLSWGPDVWTAESHKAGLENPGQSVEHKRDGRVLQAYLDRVFDHAEANPVTDPETQDVWDYVSQIEVAGERITRAEMQGIANVLLAGGRDTVIKLITGLVWHLIDNPSDRDFLRDNPQWFNRTVGEMVRYLSPLPKMERVLAALAGETGYSPSHFQRVFTRHTGLSPAAYARALMQERAAQALTGEGKVTEAIYAAGYSAPSRFYDSNKGRLGMAASAWANGGSGVTIHWAVVPTTLGPMLVAATDKGVCRLSFNEGREALSARFPKAELVEGGQAFAALLEQVIAAVEAPGDFAHIPLDVKGTAFQEAVWQELRRIPAGETRTYAQLAAAIGRPKAVRAAGSANGANNVAVLIPCHRVIATGGGMGGYAYGLEIKRKLLAKEGAIDEDLF